MKKLVFPVVYLQFYFERLRKLLQNYSLLLYSLSKQYSLTARQLSA